MKEQKAILSYLNTRTLASERDIIRALIHRFERRDLSDALRELENRGDVVQYKGRPDKYSKRL